MKFLVQAGNHYEQEVEAVDHQEAVKRAFAMQLPVAIGEIIGVRTANPKKKNGWDSPAYRLSLCVLRDVGCLHLYKPQRRGWLLLTDHPEVEKAEVRP